MNSSEERFRRDTLVAFNASRYSDIRYIEAMRDIRERRGEWI